MKLLQLATRAMTQTAPRLASLLPLLARELTEQSARRRTYVLRVLYASALYVFSFLTLWDQMQSWSGQSFAILGHGGQMFERLAWLQFCGLYLFLPAMTSGVLTAEKERDTLSLLMLTRLGPWSILIGKLFSRLIPMASFILLSLPLVAVAYSLGGLEAQAIVVLAWSLVITALQIGSLALACSAWCRTTAGAFLASYLIAAAVIGGPPFLTQGGHHDPMGILEFLHEYCLTIGMTGDGEFSPEETTFLLFGPWVSLHPNSQGQPFENILIRSIPILLMTGACLVFSRVVLWRRAFVQASNLLLRIFRSLDALFHRLNQNRLTRGIVLIHESVALPLYEPIRWRETKKRALGTTRYLIRLLVVLEFPLLFAMLIPYEGPLMTNTSPIHITTWILWIIATLVIVIQSTGLIGAERSRQTLDVLLTTPLTSDEIVREKFSGVWRLIRMLWIPFATVYLFHCLFSLWVGGGSPQGFDLIRGIIATAIYLPLIAWIGFHFSMRCRSQTQATLITLGAIAGACLIPLLFHVFESGIRNEFLGVVVWNICYAMRFMSPVVALSERLESLYFREYSGDDLDWSPEARFLGITAHFVGAGLLLAFLWTRGLRSFARFVNRNDGQSADDDQNRPAS